MYFACPCFLFFFSISMIFENDIRASTMQYFLNLKHCHIYIIQAKKYVSELDDNPPFDQLIEVYLSSLPCVVLCC